MVVHQARAGHRVAGLDDVLGLGADDPRSEQVDRLGQNLLLPLDGGRGEQVGGVQDDPDGGVGAQLLQQSPQFDHTVAQLRQKRETAKAYADAAEAYADQGYRVLDVRPAWRDTSCIELRWLRTPEGDAVTEAAVTNPAHWAVRLEEEVAFVDRETGEPVDEDLIDFNTEDDPTAEADEGLRHFSTVIQKAVLTPEWYCIDHQGAGLDLDTFLKNARPVVHGEGQATNLDEDQAEARARREAEEAEAAKRERRKTIQSRRTAYRHWHEETQELVAERQRWIDQHIGRDRSQDQGLDYGIDL